MDDFDRNVWCLLGIPVDVISFEEALQRLVSSARDGSSCFFSTPNLNFIIEALKNGSFRDSVLQSDLVLLDGTPPVWVARMLGIPGAEKVSGSNLFEALSELDLPEDQKIKVFLFGGEAGIAEKACQNINSSSQALSCVGFLNPGFGSVAEMSSEKELDMINQSEADFILVSLGAKKGQAWILSNKSRLTAPVVSHLGAVMNFVAGSVIRAPVWMQRSGLEWIWRIWQEPALWSRYVFDGAVFCRLLIGSVIPHAIFNAVHSKLLVERYPVSLHVETSGNCIVLRINGSCVHSNINVLRAAFRRESVRGFPVQLDLSEVNFVDGSFLGLCLVLFKQLENRGQPLSCIGLSTRVKRIFRLNLVDFLV